MVDVVGLAGDWHGNTRWAMDAVRRLAVDHRVTTLLHLGDFGIWPGPPGEAYLHKVDRVCHQHNVRLLVTPGNHENWPRINRTPVEARDDIGPVVWLRDHIAVLPRGHRFTLNDRSVVSLGGAPSVDFEHRTPGKDWWVEEMIGHNEAAVAAAAGRAEIMLTHDSPGSPWCTRKVAHVCTTNSGGWSTAALAYAAVGRQRLTLAFQGVRPDVLVHGHYHVADEAVVTHRGHTCRVVALHMDGHDGNLALLDTGDLTVTWV